MESRRFSPTTLGALFFFLLFCSSSPAAMAAAKIRRRAPHGPPRQPCRSLVLYFHDIVYNGENAANATSAIVAAPEWANRTILAQRMNFGDVVIFDDPVTLDNGLHSPPVGRAQGIYLYDKKEVYTAWMSFTLALNSTDYHGTISLLGADPLMNKTRDISVVGGTGDFFMARGIATVRTDAFEGEVYFRLRLDIKLYECY